MRVIKTYHGEVRIVGEDSSQPTATFHPINLYLPVEAPVSGTGNDAVQAMQNLASELRSIADSIEQKAKKARKS